MPDLQQNPEVQEQISMTEISNRIKEVTNELNQLKNSLNELSLEEKNEKIAEIESTILDCSHDLEALEISRNISIDQKELNELKSKVNILKSQKESLKKQIEAQTKLAIDELNQAVTQSQSTEQTQQDWEQKDWKEKKWLWRQREALTSKQEWKENTWKNILRTLWWVWIAAWIWKLGKRIFGGKDKEKTSTTETWKTRRQLRKERREQRRKERAERRANRPWWQKFLIWSAIAGWTVVWWVQIYKNWNRIKSWVKEKLWKSLTFEESLSSVEAEVYNWVHKEDNFWKVGAHFEWIHFNKDTSEIESFWEITKIDYKRKAIYTSDGEGIWKVQFSNRKELIHAVNIVNFAKRALKWRANNPKPFTVSTTWGDINFEWTEFIGASGSSFWTYLLWWVWAVGWWLLWWYWAWIKWAAIWTVGWWLAGYTWWSLIDNESTMNNICPTIKKWTNLHLFVNYLNDQKRADWTSLWESIWEQEKQPDNFTPIHVYLNKLIKEIEDSYWSEDSDRRNLTAEMDENDPTVYTIKSYNQIVKIKLEWCTAKQGDVWVDFSHITNMRILKYNEKDRWDWLDIDFPHNEEWLTELIRTANLTNKIREDFKEKWWDDYPFYWGRYSTPPCLDMDTAWFRGNTILSRDWAKKMPTLFKDLQQWSNWWLRAAAWYTKKYQKEMHDQAINDKNSWSQYIKFLHQMWQWKYRKNPNTTI